MTIISPIIVLYYLLIMLRFCNIRDSKYIFWQGDPLKRSVLYSCENIELLEELFPFTLERANLTTHKGHLTAKFNSKTVPVLPSFDPSLLYPFHLSPSPVHPIGFSFCLFPGFLDIFILFSSNNNRLNTEQQIEH